MDVQLGRCNMAVTAEKAILYRLVDMLPERDIDAARRMLRGLLIPDEDPVLRAFLEAPEGDEDMSPEDLESLARGDADVAAGRVISDEELRRRLDL
jgi:hypothetical protein